MNSTKGRQSLRNAEQWFTTGEEAMSHKNWDYALECFSQAVLLEPDNNDYRKQKHRSSRRVTRRSTDVSRVTRIKIAAIKSRISTASLKNDWELTGRLAEECLALNPWDADSFAQLGKASAEAGRLQIARYAWSCAVKLDKENGSYYRSFGGVLQQLGEYELAKGCFQKIRDIDPTGRIATELIRAVDIAAIINQGGLASADSAHDVERLSGRDADPTCEVTQASAEAEDSETESRVTSHQSLVMLVTTAENHVQQGQLFSAFECYQQAIEIVPNDETVQRRAEDVELAMLRQSAIEAQRLLSVKEPDENADALVQAKARKLAERESEVYRHRIERRQDDVLSAFQLADVYRRAGEFAKALPLFQKVMSDRQLRPEAMIGVGECLIRLEKASVGHQHLIASLKLLSPTDKPNSYKLAHYWLARLYESQKYLEQCEAHYAEILKVDADYRDVSVRLRRIQGQS